jgi:hypothetical protein
LRAAFTGPFLEGQNNTYRHDYVNPSVFYLLVQWLYTQKIDPHIEIDSVLESAENVNENGVCDREKLGAVDGAADAGTNDGAATRLQKLGGLKILNMLSSGWLATDSLCLICRTRYGYPLPLSSARISPPVVVQSYFPSPVK